MIEKKSPAKLTTSQIIQDLLASEDIPLSTGQVMGKVLEEADEDLNVAEYFATLNEILETRNKLRTEMAKLLVQYNELKVVSDDLKERIDFVESSTFSNDEE